MKVSLIVPVYNGEDYVETALKSIPIRTDIEVIIINDGSTDRTQDICEFWANNTFLKAKVINLSENKGLGNAKNVGYDNATGEYINQLDSDDFLYKEYEQVINELDGTDIVYMDLKKPNNEILHFNEETSKLWGSGCARFIRREFLGDTRCPQTRFAEDYELAVQLNEKKPTEKFTGIVGYHYNYPRER